METKIKLKTEHKEQYVNIKEETVCKLFLGNVDF